MAALGRVGLLLVVVGAAARVAPGPADPALIGLLLLAVATTVHGYRQAGWLGCLRPLHPAALTVLVAVATAAAAHGWTGASLREFVQVGLVLGLGTWVGSGLDHVQRRWLGRGLAVSFVLTVGVALWQAMDRVGGQVLLTRLYGAPWPEGSGPALAEEVATGLLPSHALYGLTVVLGLPFAVAALALAGRRVLLAGALLLCLLAQQTLASWCLVATALAGAWIALNAGPLRDVARLPWLTAACAGAVLCLAGARVPGAAPAASVWERADPFGPVVNGVRAPKRSVVEAAAALASLRRHPLGWGPGSYLASIHRARNEAALPQPLENRVRRDGTSQYLIVGVESGLVAMLGLGWLLAAGTSAAARRALGSGRGEADGAREAAAALAAVLGLAVVGAWTTWMVRGLGPLCGLLVGMALGPPGSPDGNLSTPRRRLGALAFQAALLLLAAGLPAVLARPASGEARAASPRHPSAAAPPAVVRIEAEDALRVWGKLEVRAANRASGLRALCVPADAGKQAGGAQYRAVVEQAASYRLWLRVQWAGGCANSVDCRVGDGPALTIEDAIFGRWHWVDAGPGQFVRLEAGPVDIRLDAAEDDVWVDTIALLADLEAVPADADLGLETAGEPPPPSDDTGPDNSTAPRDTEFDKYRE